MMSRKYKLFKKGDFWRFLVMRPRSIFEVYKIWKIRNYTMNNFSSIYQMKELNFISPKGAIVETGCWKGGLGAYVATFGRDTWLFDSFEGLPGLTKEDGDLARMKKGRGYISTDKTHAENIAKMLGVKPHIIAGWFLETLPECRNRIGNIAILRLDGDSYSSTKEALHFLYDNVVEGGHVVIDDFQSFDGCRKALYEFFLERDIYPKLKKYPFGKFYFRKGKASDL